MIFIEQLSNPDFFLLNAPSQKMKFISEIKKNMLII